MSSTATAEASAPNASTTTDNPALTFKPTTDAPSYTSDVSPPAYSDAAPTYDLAAPPSTSDPSTTPADAADAANQTSAASASPSAPMSLEEGTELDATPIPFHFLIQSSTSADSSSSSQTTPTTTTTKKITHTHPVPDILLGPSPPAEAQDLFVDVLSDALGAHQEECRAAAPQACDICGEEAASVLLTPISFLHVDENQPPEYNESEVVDAEEEGDNDDGDNSSNPLARRLGRRVEVLVTPVCARDNCGQLARKRLRCAMEDTHNDHEHEERVTVALPQGPEDPRCKVCGVNPPDGGAKKCAGCGVVRYCGRECQRKDWRAGHKRLCATYAELVEDGRMEEVVGMEEVVQRTLGGQGTPA